MLLEIKQNVSWIFLKKHNLLPLCTRSLVTQFLKKLYFFHIYSEIHPLQKAKLQYFCSALVFENLEKTPVIEFDISIKVSSVGPLTTLRKWTLSFFYFKHWDHDYRRTILENIFLVAAFGKICTGKSFDIKSELKS